MGEEFTDAVASALERKLEKLTTAEAERRILLFEKEWGAYSSSQLARVLGSLTERYPALAKVDEVWLADTWFRAREGYVDFDRVLPAQSASPERVATVRGFLTVRFD